MSCSSSLVVDGGHGKIDRWFRCGRVPGRHRGDAGGTPACPAVHAEVGDDFVGRRERTASSLGEGLEQRGAELRAHSAVDEEVGRVAQQDEQVYKHRRRVPIVFTMFHVLCSKSPCPTIPCPNCQYQPCSNTDVSQYSIVSK